MQKKSPQSGEGEKRSKKKAEHSVRKEKPGLCPFFCYAKKKAVRVAHFFCKKKMNAVV